MEFRPMGSGYKKEVISEETTSFVRRMRLELTRNLSWNPIFLPDHFTLGRFGQILGHFLSIQIDCKGTKNI